VARFFATCASGLEDVLAEELRGPRIGAKEIRPGSSGVHFRGTLPTGYRANLWLRTAVRVLVRLERAPTPGPDALYEWIRRIAWERLMSVDQTLSVDARVWDSNLTHSRFAAFRVKDAICDRFRERVGSRPDVDPTAADLPLFLHVFKNHATLYRDMSGQSLHKRGYRSAMHRSSLNECVAAGLLLLSGWDRRADLADPMCGSGTIAIEAALLALERAPGLLRRRPFPFEAWPDFDRKLWGELRTEARACALDKLPCRIMANDSHAGAVSLARRDASAARLHDDRFTIGRADVEHYVPPALPALVVSNPPWGERLAEEAELAWRKLGRWLKARCGGASAHLLSGNPGLTRFLGLKATRRHPLQIGRVDCRLIRYDIQDRADRPGRPRRSESDRRGTA
jgi:putative N6-adenine-specific DNA methylase